MPRLTPEDLNHVLEHTRGLWDEVRGRRIFITGGTGFFGCWLLETFAWANDKLRLSASATVLSRSPISFRARVPHLADHPAIELRQGDIRYFDFPDGEFDFIIHGASGSPGVFEIIARGTERILDFAEKTKKTLFISSGAVYGKQPEGITHVSEDYRNACDMTDSVSSYAVGKRAGECLCALYFRRSGLQVKIARCFAFVGPYLPLNANFAIGNFIHDGLCGRPIQIQGDGTPYRSFLYAADLAIWLWTILFRGEANRPYNVGSENGLTIKDLAHTVARAFASRPEVMIARQSVGGHSTERYVPSTKRAYEELGLKQRIGLEDAIERTIKWYSPC